MHRKDLEINLLKLQLKREEKRNKEKVRDICDLTKAKIQEMVFLCQHFQKHSLEKMSVALFDASHVSSAESVAQLQDIMKSIDGFEDI